MPALPSQGTFLNWFPRKYRPANGPSADAPRGRRATSFDPVRPPGTDTNVVLNTSSGSNAPCTHSSAATRHVFPRLSAPPRAPPHFQTFDPPLSLRISADIIPTPIGQALQPRRMSSLSRRLSSPPPRYDPYRCRPAPRGVSRRATTHARRYTRTTARPPDRPTGTFLPRVRPGQSGVTGESFCPPKIYIWKMMVADDVSPSRLPTAEFARS